MFEEQLKQISEKIKERELKKFYCLISHTHKRGIYFSSSKESMSFIKQKFHSFKKKPVYFLLKIGILQPFLNKVKLSKELGDVIFTAGKITCFNLKKNEVLSFPLNENRNKKFIASKMFQREVANYDFAPKVYEINGEVPYAKEELLQIYNDIDYINVFKKLKKYYYFVGIKKIPIKEYVINLKKELERQNIKNDLIDKQLDAFSKKELDLLVTTLHGDFAKENTLVKNGELVFIDWNKYHGLIIGDIINFFRGEENLLKNKNFKKVLELYPPTVQENIKVYLDLHNIFLLIK